MKNFYVKAIGDNRFAGGTTRWLRVRSVTEDGDVKVITKEGEKYIKMPQKGEPKNLKFTMGSPKGMPVMWTQVKKELQQNKESKMKLSKAQLKETIKAEVKKCLKEQSEPEDRVVREEVKAITRLLLKAEDRLRWMLETDMPELRKRYVEDLDMNVSEVHRLIRKLYEKVEE